jgi:hypothetical protein
VIAITAKSAKGFHRCGVLHPPTRTFHADDKFTGKQLVALRQEPSLVLEEGLPNPKPEPKK